MHLAILRTKDFHPPSWLGTTLLPGECMKAIQEFGGSSPLSSATKKT